MIQLSNNNLCLDVITSIHSMDGVRVRFLLACNFAEVYMFVNQLPVLITASQPVKLFWKGLMGLLQECSVINF